MELTVYRRRDGAYLLMPAASRAFKQVDEMHGPLVLCTHIAVDELDSKVLSERVLADIGSKPRIGLAQGLACPFPARASKPTGDR